MKWNQQNRKTDEAFRFDLLKTYYKYIPGNCEPAESRSVIRALAGVHARISKRYGQVWISIDIYGYLGYLLGLLWNLSKTGYMFGYPNGYLI
jgi:hypothetical protein